MWDSPARVPSGTLIELFHTTAKRYPDGPAVVDGDTTVNYTEVDIASSAVARMLQNRGITLEDRVGVYLERSSDLYVTLLGILKAGAAYVAVDTRYPDARRDFMLVHSSAKVVVTDLRRAADLQHLGIEVVTVVGAEGDPDPVEVAPATAASVLFTSGSSGEPKAVVLEHRNLVSFATNPGLPRLRPGERVGQISSVSFDAFHFEVWTVFADGACSVVLPPVPELLAADFQRQMRRHGIVAMLVPTMVVNQVVRADVDAFAPLRILQVGGDIILPSACRDLLAGEFRGEMFNLYGPTEISTACTAHRITAEDAESDTIPIGRPIDGVTVHVLDAGLSPVPAGQAGEIFVGGPGVARGYQDRPELTAERFLTLDHLGDPGRRFYRTGDLARRRADGVLEFAGRADRQVKIRGYRVEPEEVERGLRRHHDVHDAVVLPDGEGDERWLIAFVALDEGLTIPVLRSWTEAELPDFMVPSRFVTLPEIPANGHGKRDSVVLQHLLAEHRRRSAGYAAPSTDTERYLADLWGELLGIERVGRDEDFFGLGGHSMQAFRMYRRIGRDLGVDLEFPVVIDAPVLSKLAQAIDELRTPAGSA
jgi:amino acid adenylation domain-containing protein